MKKIIFTGLVLIVLLSGCAAKAIPTYTEVEVQIYWYEARVRAWEDLNGNGIWEQDEPGLAGVQVQLQSQEPGYTLADSSILVEGTNEGYEGEALVEAQIPFGYVNTTSLSRSFTLGEDTLFNFGFKKMYTPYTGSGPAWCEDFLKAQLPLVSCAYRPNETVELSFGPLEHVTVEKFYFRVFTLLRSYRGNQVSTDTDEIRIRFLPSGTLRVCDYEKVWMERLILHDPPQTDLQIADRICFNLKAHHYYELK